MRTLFFLLAGILSLVLIACEPSITPQFPAVPANLLVYADSGTAVKLVWNGDSLASGYEVYRSTDPYYNFVSIASTPATSYRDEKCARDTVYYYKVSAHSSEGSSALSSTARCRTPNDSDTAVKSFWSVELTDSGERPYKTWAKFRAVGTHCEVYCEIPNYTGNTPVITDGQIDGLITEFDDKIYNKLTPVYGAPVGVDEKITLLLLDIQDDYSGSDGYVAGFFHPKDMFQNETYSNNRPMLYIDIYPGGFGSSEKEQQLFNTMAHEFQHLVNFSIHPFDEIELWINEGLSESAGYVYRGGLDDSRINYYRQDPDDSIAGGNTFYVWHDDWNDPLAEYATAYLFFQWLRIHSGGTTIYSDIINSVHSDYRAVVDAVNANFPASMDWEEILRTWLAANFLCDESSLYGYKNEIEKKRLALRTITAESNLLYLAPGEGVFSKIDASSLITPPTSSYGGYSVGRNIRYAGVFYNKAGTENGVDPDAPFTSNYLLTFNANTKSELAVVSDYEIGYVAGVWQSAGNSRFAGGGAQVFSVDGREQDEAAPEEQPQPYEWDSARYFFERANPVPRPSKPVLPR